MTEISVNLFKAAIGGFDGLKETDWETQLKFILHIKKKKHSFL